MRKLALACLVAFGFGASGGAAPAQAPVKFPDQPVRILVPFSAGSVTDLLARTISDRLAERWGQPVIIENRPGIAGTGVAAKAAPDGHNLMLTSNGHTIIGLVNKNLTFDPIADFTGVIRVASMPTIMIVPPDMPVSSLKEFVDYVRARPKQLNFASSGLASTAFIGAELFRQTAKLDMTHVPFKGSPEAQTAVIRNDAQMFFTLWNVGSDLIQAGKLKALAVTTDKRLPTLPNVPTFAEAGMPEFSYDAWFGLLAPAGTPPAIVNKINADVAAVIALPDVQQRLAQQGVTFAPNQASSFSAAIASDAARFKTMFAGAGIGN
ncbi:tripartite tricarboxylate transporter substrate binding protein [Pseudorhodoplanes sp.]|uniref:Bug family tripartite tricarboxylate transporter substrate binding protein n=1 Tax=Pseudorhodoplanes sp. TaxID=1934341 RepID=UPI002C90B55F|nr:tripartite tricarboxylate transporter substrate binding protein [Pseudorhodoplanes sp.]HWV53970.1 tripartite tricarboxylate transporter substrate binding protein [Pseudorhodoplanes sp.]